MGPLYNISNILAIIGLKFLSNKNNTFFQCFESKIYLIETVPRVNRQLFYVTELDFRLWKKSVVYFWHMLGFYQKIRSDSPYVWYFDFGSILIVHLLMFESLDIGEDIVTKGRSIKTEIIENWNFKLTFFWKMGKTEFILSWRFF